MSRTNNLTSPVLAEAFTSYDNLDRLQDITLNGNSTQNTSYDLSGNIASKSDVGTYGYEFFGSTKPHAVTAIDNPTAAIPDVQQDITYTAFNKANNILENGLNLHFTYGPDYARKMSVLTNTADNSLVRKVIYLGDYEEVTTAGGTYKVHYISSPDGLAAIHVIPPSGGGGLCIMCILTILVPSSVCIIQADKKCMNRILTHGEEKEAIQIGVLQIPTPPRSAGFVFKKKK